MLEVERVNEHKASRCSRVTTSFIETSQFQASYACREDQFRKRTLQEGPRSQNTSYSNLGRHFMVVIF
jgi:hypothetical protein